MALGAVASARRVATTAARALSALADLILPIACASCGRVVDDGEPGIVCGRCWA